MNEGMKAALKARDERRLAALRAIRAAFVNEMKKDNAATLSDEVCVAVLRRLEKQRQESIEAFAAADRPERAEAELEVIQGFLPQLADAETTRSWVRAAIAETGAAGPRDLGKVMGALMKAHRGEVDGGLARRLASEQLGE